MSVFPHLWCLGCFLGVFWWFEPGRVGVCTPLWFRGITSVVAGLFTRPCVVCATGTYAKRSECVGSVSSHVSDLFRGDGLCLSGTSVLVLIERQMDKTFAVFIKDWFSTLVVSPVWGGGGVARTVVSELFDFVAWLWVSVSQGEVMGRGCRT